jgi:hypothetical protein
MRPQGGRGNHDALFETGGYDLSAKFMIYTHSLFAFALLRGTSKDDARKRSRARVVANHRAQLTGSDAKLYHMHTAHHSTHIKCVNKSMNGGKISCRCSNGGAVQGS